MRNAFYLCLGMTIVMSIGVGVLVAFASIGKFGVHFDDAFAWFLWVVTFIFCTVIEYRRK